MRFRQLLDNLETSLWFRPTLWVIGLGFFAFAFLYADDQLRFNAASSPLPWLYTGGPDAAVTILGSIGAATLTVTTLSFSIIMVAVVQAANAYSPRVLRQYLSDTVDQHVLGILLGTFLFSLLVLRAVNVRGDEEFVPELSVTAAIMLALLSIAAFIYFINHVAHSIEVDTIIHLFLNETRAIFDEIFPETLGEPWRENGPPAMPEGEPALVRAEESGYVVFIEPNDLLEAVSAADAVVRLNRSVGDYVIHGTPLVAVWPPAALDDELRTAIRNAFQLGTERTFVQDLYFGVRQIVDIALRAISPSVNDPTTAINCIDALGTVLGKMARHEPISPYRCDQRGVLRVVAPAPSFEDMLDLAFDQIRQYGAGDFAVTLRLIEVSCELGTITAAHTHRAALWRVVRMLARSAAARFEEPNDRATINSRLAQAAAQLGHDVEPLLLDIVPDGELQFLA